LFSSDNFSTVAVVAEVCALLSAALGGRCILFCSEDRKKCALLVREKRVNGERIEKLKEVVRDMMEKKFGRQVSVAKLELLIINPYVVELHQDQHDFAVACALELKDWNVRPA